MYQEVGTRYCALHFERRSRPMTRVCSVAGVSFLELSLPYMKYFPHITLKFSLLDDSTFISFRWENCGYQIPAKKIQCRGHVQVSVF